MSRSVPFLFAEEKLALAASIVITLSVLLIGGQLSAAQTTRSEVAIILATAAPVIRRLKEQYLPNSAKSLRLVVGLVQAACIGICLPLLYQVIGDLTVSIHNHDYDQTLIAIDKAIFDGNSPSVWLAQNLPSSRIGVEIMQICYCLYYTLPLALGIDLWASRNRLTQRPFDTFSFVLAYGFLLSCVGYLLVPAIGPRFTLHEFSKLQYDLPGLWLTEPLRRITNAGELINSTMSSTEAAKHVLRDAFPSGHTMITVIVVTLAFRYRSRVRWILLPVGVGLILATVYLRYHYVIDVIGGIAFAGFTFWSAPWLYRVLTPDQGIRQQETRPRISQRGFLAVPPEAIDPR